MRVAPLIELGILYYKVVLKHNYDVEIKGGDNLKAFQKEGFVLLPKHQHTFDIPLEAIVLKNYLNRHAYYIMKDSLPGFYRLLGGIPIKRAKEIKNEDKEKRATLIEEAKKTREYVRKKMLELLLKDEIVVFHFEGGTAYKKETILNPAILNRLIRTQKDYLMAKGKELYFVPMDIYYEDVHRKHTQIEVTVGNPFTAPNLEELADSLIKNIELVKPYHKHIKSASK